MRTRLVARLVAIVVLFLLTAAPAAAEDREWISDPPKQGTAGFHLCVAEAEAGGHSYRNVNYIDNEILGNCDRYGHEDVVRYFKFRHNIDLDPASVRVEVRPVR